MADDGRLLDEETARVVNAGRESASFLVDAARAQLQKVFIAFIIGLFAGYLLMRQWVWPTMEQRLITNPHVSVIYRTPFDVFLFQAKAGLFVGVCFALPLLIYYAREPLRQRGILPDLDLSWWKIGLLV